MRELLAGAGLGEGEVARRLLGDLAYRGGALEGELYKRGILLATEKAEQALTDPPAGGGVLRGPQARLQYRHIDGTLAKTLTGLATRRIATKVAAYYTYGCCYVNRLLGRPQGRVKELWV